MAVHIKYKRNEEDMIIFMHDVYKKKLLKREWLKDREVLQILKDIGDIDYIDGELFDNFFGSLSFYDIASGIAVLVMLKCYDGEVGHLVLEATSMGWNCYDWLSRLSMEVTNDNISLMFDQPYGLVMKENKIITPFQFIDDEVDKNKIIDGTLQDFIMYMIDDRTGDWFERKSEFQGMV